MDRSALPVPPEPYATERQELRATLAEAAHRDVLAAIKRKSAAWDPGPEKVSFRCLAADWRQVVEALIEIEDGALEYAKMYLTRDDAPEAEDDGTAAA